MTPDESDRTTTFSRANSVPRCSVCGGPRYQKHLEVCPGPMQRIADPPVRDPGCGCVGAWHDPGCYLLTEGDAA